MKTLSNKLKGKNYEIPKEAKCVFQGEIFDVYQWEQAMFDGTTQIFEKLKRADTVQVIPVLNNGNILILKEVQPNTGEFITFPGGRSESGEAPETTATRELLEETGIEAQELKLWEKFTPFSKIEWDAYYFIARGLKFVKKPKLDSGEKIELKEITFDDFLNLTEDATFKAGDLENILIKARYDTEKREELRKLLYG